MADADWKPWHPGKIIFVTLIMVAEKELTDAQRDAITGRLDAALDSVARDRSPANSSPMPTAPIFKRRRRFMGVRFNISRSAARPRSGCPCLRTGDPPTGSEAPTGSSRRDGSPRTSATGAATCEQVARSKITNSWPGGILFAPQSGGSTGLGVISSHFSGCTKGT